MEKATEKFLEFNGKAISFLNVDGEWWVAVKPICEALKVDYEAQRKNLQKDKILGQLPSTQTVVAADGRLRNMLCLPEEFIYGWIFTIQSEAPGLDAYKKECYQVLFKHFHGGVRSKLVKESAMRTAQIEILHAKVHAKNQNDEDYKLAKKLEAENQAAGKQLQALDREEKTTQLNLFREQFQTNEN